MGVSFKIAKTGTRYRSRLAEFEDEEDKNGSGDSQPSVNQGNFSGVGDEISDVSNVLAKTGLHSASDDIEVSFSLNLFPNGFSIGKASESFKNAPEQLYPYNRASQSLFSAIEYGYLPGDLFDDLPFKYVNGSVLCQIQDYRNCLFQLGGISSIQKSPTVHRVILQMCMENVIKDIMSISGDSWTYKDLLEVESCVLKALQPNLCLNPQPLLGKHYREPQAKKVNLGILRSFKQREQLEAPATNQVFGNSSHVTVTPGSSACHNSDVLCDLVGQDRGVMSAKINIPTSVRNREHNILQELNSRTYPLTSSPDCHFGETRDLSTLAELNTSSVSVPRRSWIKRTIDQTKLTSSNLNVNVRCKNQAIQGALLKKPKKEPVDCSYQQFPGKAIETSAPLHLQWKNTALHQQIEAEKSLPKRFLDKGCPSQLNKNSLPSNHEGIFYPQAGPITSTGKLEPVQTCFPGLDFGNMKDNYFVRDRRVNPSDGVQFQSQQSLHLLKTNNPMANALQNSIMLPVDKDLRKENVRSRRKVLEKSQLIYDGNTPASSRNVDSLPIEASASSKRKATPPKGFGINLVNSSANANNISIASATNVNTANAKSLPGEIRTLSQTSEIERPLLERLLKIKEVTQRCELTKKRKLEQNLVRNQIIYSSRLVASCLSNCEDSGNSEVMTMDKASLSSLSMGRSNVSNTTRTLMFILKPSLVYQGNETYVDGRDVQVRLVLMKKFNKGTVEANVLYGCQDDMTSTVLASLPTFPSVHSADLFASQFSLVMDHEGYCLDSDRVEPAYPETEGGSSNQQRSSTVNQSAGNWSMHDSSHLLSKQMVPLTQLLTSKNVQSSPQFTSNCSPELEPDIASQFGSMELEMQDMMSRRFQLQLQMQQRQRQQYLLMQKKAVNAGSSRTLQPDGSNGIHGIRNFSLGSFGNVTGPMTSTTKTAGGYMPLSGNIGPKIRSNTRGVNESRQLLPSYSDYLAPVSSKLMSADSQMRGFAGGFPIQRNDLLVPINRTKVPEIPYPLSNQNQQQLQIYQHEMQWPQLCMLQQQEMRLPMENLESVKLIKQEVGSSLSQLSSQQVPQQLQMNQQQQSAGLVLEEMKRRNAIGSRGEWLEDAWGCRWT